MHVAKATLAVAAFLSAALAGCTGAGEAGGFSVSGSDGTYKFTASGSADNYTWDLGDHLTRAYTKTVEHTYDFADGTIPVVLTVTDGGKRTEYRREIVLGSGANQNAGFVLEGSTNWTVLGESVTFSAHRSSDPEGDPLRYTWSCQRVGDAVRQSAHAHPGFGGIPFATPAAGAIISINAQGPLPAATRTVPGDLCEGLGTGGRPSLDATISGAFTKSGIYDIYLLASDPLHPTTSGKYRIIATPASERPTEVNSVPFTGTFLVGANGAIQSVCESSDQCPQTFDRANFGLNLPLAAQSGNLSLSYVDQAGVMNIACQLFRGTSALETATGPSGKVALNPGNLKAGAFTITCQPTGPVTPTSPDGVSYTVTVDYDLDMDPFKVY